MFKHCQPFCVLRAPIDQLRLSTEFFLDLLDVLADEHRYLSAHQAIAECLLNGAYAREHVTRRVNFARVTEQTLPPLTTYAIIGALLLRPRYPLPATAIRHLNYPTKFYPDHVRANILDLLYQYGVACARPGCCLTVLSDTV